jgi:hypothetical protein
MELATRVTQIAIGTVSGIHCDAADKVATTLATADHIVKAATYAGKITPDKEVELRRHTKEYLNEMLAITYEAGDKIIDVLLSR